MLYVAAGNITFAVQLILGEIKMIEVHGLTKHYDDVKAVDGISFSVQQGEIVGLLGPNGAGKTTTLRMLTCYLTPTGGEATLAKHNIYEEPTAIKRLIGYLPESAPLYRDMVVYDYLCYIAEIQEIPKEKIEGRITYVADKCGLNGVIHKKIGELSKGYRQRVGLAHAIIHDPEILILDEPTTGLDPNQIIEIRELIKELGREKTVILSTHILSEVEASCDRVIIIDCGKIVADKSTKALVSESKTGTVSVTLKNVSRDDAEKALSSIEGVTQTFSEEYADNVKIRVMTNSPEQISERIYYRVKETDWAIIEMVIEHESLEDIFRELTKEAL